MVAGLWAYPLYEVPQSGSSSSLVKWWLPRRQTPMSLCLYQVRCHSMNRDVGHILSTFRRGRVAISIRHPRALSGGSRCPHHRRGRQVPRARARIGSVAWRSSRGCLSQYRSRSLNLSMSRNARVISRYTVYDRYASPELGRPCCNCCDGQIPGDTSCPVGVPAKLELWRGFRSNARRNDSPVSGWCYALSSITPAGSSFTV